VVSILIRMGFEYSLEHSQSIAGPAPIAGRTCPTKFSHFAIGRSDGVSCSNASSIKVVAVSFGISPMFPSFSALLAVFRCRSRRPDREAGFIKNFHHSLQKSRPRASFTTGQVQFVPSTVPLLDGCVAEQRLNLSPVARNAARNALAQITLDSAFRGYVSMSLQSRWNFSYLPQTLANQDRILKRRWSYSSQ
jgi:hypothetical protein